ncbi:MAG TPA: DUF177 domain-containing protein [Verrucomicrobiae bacterium]|nr:DUF177 domain-containing protein [Verrucomicrobiae bacterium]
MALKLRVDDIKPDKPRTVAAEEPVSSFPTLAEMVDRGEVTLAGPVRVDITATAGYDHIRVDGRVSGAAELVCSRCLADYRGPLESAFTIFYRKAAPGEEEVEEVELSDVDLLSATYAGDEIDLTPEIEGQLITEIPIKPLCSESCKGLCSSCGADLNRTGCGCGNTGRPSAFEALKNFKVKK